METRNNRRVPSQPVHPGEILREELRERGITQKALARDLAIGATHLNEFIRGKRNISATLALRLEARLGIPFRIWMSLHKGYLQDCAATGVATEPQPAPAKAAESGYDAALLLETRRAARLTQGELARRLGVDKSYISRVERGLTVPTVGQFFRIAAAMGYSVELCPPHR